MDDATKEGFEAQIKEYEKLKRISNSKEFKDFFDLQLKIVADKMIWGFGTKIDKETKKVSDNIENWNDFCKWRGEIIARLQPIQEVQGAEATVTYLKKQLDGYYKQPV